MKRFLLLDITSIKPCNSALLKKLEKYELPELVPGKGAQEQTNLGHFRYYLMDLLRLHPDVNQQMMILVRQLQPTENGLPLELIAYCLFSDLAVFENFQASLFEHLVSVLPDFDLRLYQRANSLLQ
jgi:miniconductance mechanosensitive channel